MKKELPSANSSQRCSRKGRLYHAVDWDAEYVLCEVRFVVEASKALFNVCQFLEVCLTVVLPFSLIHLEIEMLQQQVFPHLTVCAYSDIKTEC